MNVNLTRELEQLVERKVASGLYNNQSEVVREALRLMAERDREQQVHLSNLRGALAAGIGQANRGELLDGDEVVTMARRNLRKPRKSAKKRG